MENIRLLSGYILVKPFEVSEEVTKSGIILPQTRREDTLRGEVVACGKSLPNEPMEVQVGNTVMFGKHSGREVEIDDTKYRLMQQKEIYYFLD